MDVLGDDQHSPPLSVQKAYWPTSSHLKCFLIEVLTEPKRALPMVLSCAFPTAIGLMDHGFSSIDFQSVINCVYVSSGSPGGFRRNVMTAAKCMSTMTSEIPPHPHGFDPLRSHSMFSLNWLSSSGYKALDLSITAFHSSPVGSVSSQFLLVITYYEFPSVLASLPRSPTSIILTARL